MEKKYYQVNKDSGAAILTNIYVASQHGVEKPAAHSVTVQFQDAKGTK